MSDTPIGDASERFARRVVEADIAGLHFPPPRPSVTERDWWWRVEAAVIGAVIIASVALLLAAGGYFS